MKALLFLAFIAICTTSVGQDSLTASLKENYLTSVATKLKKADYRMTSATRITIRKFQRLEKKILKKLETYDSAMSKQYSDEIVSFYANLNKKILNGAFSKHDQEYSPYYDTVRTSVRYAFKDTTATKRNEKSKRIIESFCSRVNLNTQISKELAGRKLLLVERFKKHDFVSSLSAINKKLYYHKLKLDELKRNTNIKKKIEDKFLSVIRNDQHFKDFFKQNSVISQLYSFTPVDAQILSSNLQSKEVIQKAISSAISSLGKSPAEFLETKLNAANEELSKLIDKSRSLNLESGRDTDIPSFKPNTQKSKSVLKRFEYGVSIDMKKNGIFPVTSDIGLSFGYKLNDKSVVGLGSSYKVGLGQSIEKIKITYEGISLRSFLDIKLKGTFWITGGYEQNYNESFQNIYQLNDVSAWQQSGLIGLSKKSLIGKHKGIKFQLLYDFLARNQMPRAATFKYRITYNFSR